MRAWLFTMIFTAACTPQISSGAYFCGEDSLCPDHQACTGSNNTCVGAAIAETFACDPKVEQEPDDTPAEAVSVGAFQCIAVAHRADGCLHAGDALDYLTFTMPAGCAQTGLTAKVEYPTAFETVGIAIQNMDGSPVASDDACDAASPGDDARCLTASLTAGTTYLVAVAPTGDGTCDGACNFNRYSVSLSIGAP